MGFKLTTVAACRAVDMDRQRFNEFVASGDYPCAPETIPGRSRLFEEADLIALFIFAREMERGTKVAMAGKFACAVRGTLRDRPDASTAVVAGSVKSKDYYSVQPDTKITAGMERGKPLLSLTTYNLAYVRAEIRTKIDEMREIIGPESDD